MKNEPALDAIDKKILTLLQRDSAMKVADIAAAVGLSPTPCWRRIQRMEEEGVIRSRVALLDREKMNVAVSVFVAIRTSHHSRAWLDAFRQVIEDIPEIVEAYRLSGDIDYMLRIVVPDIAAYDGVYKRMIEKLEFSDISSSFTMEELKFTTALPTSYV
jgi:Lrp/AsnC family transcriptional regulator